MHRHARLLPSRIRAGLLLVAIALVLACTSAVPSARAAAAAAPATGALRVAVSGLPAGAGPTVVVRGRGERREVTAPATLTPLPVGTYTVLPRNVTVGDTTYVPTTAQTTVPVEAGRTARVQVGYTATGDTVVVDPAAVVALTRVGPGANLLELAPGTTRPRVGDYVVVSTGAHTAEGVYGRVRGVNGTLVRVRRVPLPSFVPSGSISQQRTLRPRHLQPGQDGTSSAVEGAVVVDVDLDVPCGDGATYTVSGSVRVVPAYDFSAAWSAGSVTTAEFTGTVTQSAQLTASLDHAGSCAVEAVPLLDQPLAFAPSVVTTSGVPVVVTPQLQLFAAASADADAPASASVQMDQTVTAGFDYAAATGVTPSHTITRDATAPARQVHDRAELLARVTPQVSLRVYDAPGPRVGTASELTLSAGEAMDPWWVQRSVVRANGAMDAKALGLDTAGMTLGQDGWTVAQASDLGPWLDRDGDGHANTADCGPDDPGIHPGAEDVPGDGIDQDCDGEDAVVAGPGDVEVLLRWGDSPVDLDLSVTEPSGEEIWWFEPGPTATGGALDNDWGDGCAGTLPAGGAREGVSWPDGSSPTGTYQILVDEWSDCGRVTSNWRLTVTVDDVVVAERTGRGSMTAPITVLVD